MFMQIHSWQKISPTPCSPASAFSNPEHYLGVIPDSFSDDFFFSFASSSSPFEYYLSYLPYYYYLLLNPTQDDEERDRSAKRERKRKRRTKVVVLLLVPAFFTQTNIFIEFSILPIPMLMSNDTMANSTTSMREAASQI